MPSEGELKAKGDVPYLKGRILAAADKPLGLSTKMEGLPRNGGDVVAVSAEGLALEVGVVVVGPLKERALAATAH